MLKENWTSFFKEQKAQLSSEAKKLIDENSNRLQITLKNIIEDPSIPESQKISLIIHATSLICAIVAVQPIPFADLFILTPIQVVMVTAMSRVLGNPIGKHNPKEIVASIAAVVGWGVLAQQAILGAYKTILPFLGAVTTIPLVYAATYGLGCAAKAVLEARRNDQNISEDEIKRIKEESEKAAKDSKRDWSMGSIKNEFEELKRKSDDFEMYKEMLQKSESERQQVLREKEELQKRNLNAVSDEELDDILKDNYAIRSELASIKPELESLREKSRTFVRKRHELLSNRFRHCYPSIKMLNQAMEDIVELSDHRLNSFERQLGILQYEPAKAKFRAVIVGTRVREIGFDHDGRIYVTIEGNSITIYRVGDKNSQSSGIRWIKNHNFT